jgi:hypothetical protein
MQQQRFSIEQSSTVLRKKGRARSKTRRPPQHFLTFRLCMLNFVYVCSHAKNVQLGQPATGRWPYRNRPVHAHAAADRPKPTDYTIHSDLHSHDTLPVAGATSASLSTPLPMPASAHMCACRVSLPRYWNEPSNTEQRFVPCPSPERCLGWTLNGSLCDQASINQLSMQSQFLAVKLCTLRSDLQAYDGRQCSACRVGYFRFVGDCLVCPGGAGEQRAVQWEPVWSIRDRLCVILCSAQHPEHRRTLLHGA